MKCKYCGAKVKDMNMPCDSCGAKSDYAVDNNISKKEFYNNYASSKIKDNIKFCAVIIYICSSITMVLGLALTKNIFVLIDVVLLVILGLGIHIKQSRVCAVLLLAYSAYGVINGLVMYGKFSGWWVLLAAIYAAISIFKLEKEYKKFKS